MGRIFEVYFKMSNVTQLSGERLRPGAKISGLSFVYVVLIVVSIFSLLYGWFPILHSQAYIALIAIFVTGVVSPGFFVTKQFFVILFYAAVVWINAQAGDEYTFDKTVMDGLLLGMCGGISFYLLRTDDQKAKKGITILVPLVLIIQTLPALSLYITSQDTIRNFIGLIYHGQSDYEWSQLYRMGILSYDTTHSLPMLVPPLIMWIRTKGASKTWKCFCCISLICIVILAYIYDVTTVQFLTVFSIVTSMLIYPNQPKQNRLRILMMSVFVMPFVFSNYLQEGVLNILEKVSEGNLKEKVAEARYNLTHDVMTGDMESREKFYTLSVEAFFESPIWGTNNSSKIGGHSAIFDRMGAFGVVGFIPFILIFILLTYYCRKYISPSNRWYYIICIISFAMLLIVKNMSRLEEWMMVIVVAPAMLTLKEDALINKKTGR